MSIRHWGLPLLTLVVVLFAVLLPQRIIVQWDRTELNVVHQEALDETQMVTNYALSGSERLHLLRRSGLLAQSGQICYQTSAEGVRVEVVDMLPEEAKKEPAEESSSAEFFDYAHENSVKEILAPTSSIAERVYDYLLDGLYTLEGYGVLDYDQGKNGLLVRYSKTPGTMHVNYCSITDDSDPFFSMALLCITCTLSDSEGFGLSADTALSIMMDEETGAVYALSIAGDPEYVLTKNPGSFMILADLMGVSCTEYTEEMNAAAQEYPAAENYPTAKFNFGGYSYSLQQNYQSDSYASCDFNVESYLK